MREWSWNYNDANRCLYYNNSKNEIVSCKFYWWYFFGSWTLTFCWSGKLLRPINSVQLVQGKKICLCTQKNHIAQARRSSFCHTWYRLYSNASVSCAFFLGVKRSFCHHNGRTEHTNLRTRDPELTEFQWFHLEHNEHKGDTLWNKEDPHSLKGHKPFHFGAHASSLCLDWLKQVNCSLWLPAICFIEEL